MSLRASRSHVRAGSLAAARSGLNRVTEGGKDPRTGVHVVAGTRDRYGRGGSRDPDRSAAIGRQWDAEDRTCGTSKWARLRNGIIFPKYRSDLVACATATKAMPEGHVEATRFLPESAGCAGTADRGDCGASAAGCRASGAKRNKRKATDDETASIGYDELLRLIRGAAQICDADAECL